MYLEQVVEAAARLHDIQRVAVAQAEDKEVLQAVVDAKQKGIADFLLIGNAEKTQRLLEELQADPLEFEIVAAASAEESSQLAVRMVKEKKASIVMKGYVPTATLMRAIVHKETGLRGSKLISHVAAFEVPHYDRLIFITDAAMNIAPDLKEKAQIIDNAVMVAHALGVQLPKVAPICPVEMVNPNMPSTLDAASLTLMNQRGQIKGCLVDGPLALDNAISLEAASHKGITSEVAGRADVLLAPNIETGNALYKSLTYFAQAKVGALIVGAQAPIVLTSRADTAESKLYSIALAALVAAH